MAILILLILAVILCGLSAFNVPSPRFSLLAAGITSYLIAVLVWYSDRIT